MSWTNWYSCLSEAFKKRAGRYIVNRYLGSFLENGAVLLDQLSSESGELSLENVSLDTKTINGLLESSPLELVDGYIRELRVSIPWSSLLSENCHFAIHGLTLTLGARALPGGAASTFHSMYESFSSMNLAQDMSKEEETLIGDSVGGVQYLAETIDSILTRLRVSLKDTVVRLEYVPGLEQRGLALELRIGETVYSGHTQESQFCPSSTKKVLFRQIDVLSDEFAFKNSDDEEQLKDQAPLHLARLSGSTELTLHFSEEKNDYGLPSVLEELDVYSGLLAAHVFPHQIHAVTEIFKSILPPSDEGSPRHRCYSRNIENLLQKSIILQPSSCNDIGNQWTSSSFMNESSEFHPVSRGFVSTIEPPIQERPFVFPKINIKIACFISAFIQRDENIFKLGGLPNKSLALQKMRALSDKFFEGHYKTPSLQKNRLSILHDYVSSNCSESSHVQIVGAPLQIALKDASDISLSVGELSLREILLNDPLSSPGSYQIVEFMSSQESRNPDLKVSISKKTTSEEEVSPCTEISISLNPVTLEMDLGIVDRTYCLFNYAELDPLCVKAAVPSSQPQSLLQLSLASPRMKINFFVPKVDLRSPSNIPSFVEYFWGRHVHSESLIFDINELKLSTRVSNDEVNLQMSSDLVQIFYVEDDIRYDLIEIKRSSDKPKASAASINLKVNLDEGKRLFWKFDKTSQVINSDECLMPGTDIGATIQRTLDEEISKTILEALSFGSEHNNLFIDLTFDDLSIILPSKHIYEIIYNRLGNDLLLWIPLIYRVKEYIFGVLFEDPLKQNEDFGFSIGFSNQVKDSDYFEHPSSSYSGGKKSFPKSGKKLCIHVDTCVSISIGSGSVLICPSLWVDTEDSNRALLASVEKLSFITAIGLERDPEILLFHLSVNDGSIKYGNSSTHSAQKHFLNDPRLHDLFGKTDFCGRAWLDVSSGRKPLLELTSKILFDSKNNLKSIKLSFSLHEASLSMSSDNKDFQSFVEWVLDFFTVVEFPIVGYKPPVILTEMQFDTRRSSLDLFLPRDHRLTLALGTVKVSCNFLDSSSDMSIALCLEDVGLFLSQDPMDSVESSVCFCDVDYLDLYIFLKENPQRPSTLDISCNCSLLRLRTCSDTIKIITHLIFELLEGRDKGGRDSPSTQEDVLPEQVSGEDVVPDLADAMEDILKDTSRQSSQQSKGARREKKKAGGQVFFFPDEANTFPDSLGMTQSFYADPDAMTASDIRQSYEVGDSFDEEFCILDDEIGSGIVPPSGEPTVRCLLDSTDSVVLIDNHFSIPEQSIDYLRTPKNFPKLQVSFAIKKLSVLWKIYGGNDFSSSKEMAQNTKSQLQKMGMSLYVDPQTSVIVGQDGRKKERTPPGRSARLLADNLKTRGGPGRNEDQLLEVCVHKLQLKHEVFEPEASEASRQILIIPLVEICDKLAISDINKLLYPYASRTRPQRSNANMFTYKCVNLRRENDMTESNVNVSLQPFRINIDQDTLFFIIDFVCALIPGEDGEAETPIIVPEEEESGDKEEDPEPERRAPSSSGSQPFIKSFVFSHSVPIRIDYLGKYVDLTQGTLKGLLVGLGQLNCSELTLKKVSYQSGILGLERLFKILLSDWLEDVKQNQVPSLLGGVGPMYSFLQLVQGVKDLVLLPLEQYQKDGRILRGLQKGANSFTASTAMGILDMTNRMLGLIKFMAEIAFDIMSPEAALTCEAAKGRGRRQRTVARPSDMREGVVNALAVVREGFDETARTLIDAASNEKSKKGLSGAVGGVLKQVPSTMMKPVIVAASATSNVLEGVKNQVAPEGRKEEEEKWRKPA